MGTVPWIGVPAPPWATTQALFDRTVAIHRPIKPTAVGAITYGGLLETQETVLFSGIPASIQTNRQRDRPIGNLPGDVLIRAIWNVYLPLGYANAGQIVERDVVVDDLGRRLQIFAAWAHILGWTLNAELLEA
jgi:hypothetical protein